MSEIKQVWGIIKDYQCADLEMVQGPALAVWNHQQAKIDDLQKRVDYASQEVKGLERFTGEDCIADFEVLQGAVSHACKRLERALKVPMGVKL